MSDADDWVIAAAMLNFPGQHDAPVDIWRAALDQVSRAGFTDVDPTDSWVRVADLTPSRLADFMDAVADAGLRIPAISTARRSVIDPESGDENLAYSHRVIDTAAALGARHVSLALMRPLTPAQQTALWFWTAPGPADPDDEATWRRAVTRFQELGAHAESVGVEISLELYEDTYLGTAAGAVRLVQDIGSPAVGINPDLGNLVRRYGPVEPWLEIISATAPYARYWHVKNYARAEDFTTGAAMTTPTSMALGVIDYRTAIAVAISAGFSGAFCVENYGGDGLSVSAGNRDYLRSILPQRHLPE
ncbi:sugar phosphate isomerase/epimerase family protein [Microbacterium rhizomatis]|nr:sugar phosphate isomerase/epimerase family protein [Microbacterium rhizomatis]